jgi:hypothetical protein
MRAEIEPKDRADRMNRDPRQHRNIGSERLAALARGEVLCAVNFADLPKGLTPRP